MVGAEYMIQAAIVRADMAIMAAWRVIRIAGPMAAGLAVIIGAVARMRGGGGAD